MLGVSEFLNESAGGYARAVLTGLGGAFTGGNISGGYDRYKAQEAEKALATANRDASGYARADAPVSTYLHAVGGAIPVIGVIPNTIAYHRKMKALEALRQKDPAAADAL